MLTISVALVANFTAPAQEISSATQQSHVDLVNVFTGTPNSRWMQFPGVAVPMGLVKISPDNQGNVWNGGYEYTVTSISGFSFPAQLQPLQHERDAVDRPNREGTRSAQAFSRSERWSLWWQDNPGALHAPRRSAPSTGTRFQQVSARGGRPA
jgi:hypothetical protein